MAHYERQSQRNFMDLVLTHEIQPAYADRLQQLNGVEIVFICDDSGSMQQTMNVALHSNRSSKTRWDVMRELLGIVVDMASVLDPDGVDVYFLNRPSVFNLRNSAELDPIFAQLTTGPTPITPVLRQVLQDKQVQIRDRKLLILIATDGTPTDDKGRVDIDSFEDVLRNHRNPIERIPVTIIACTDDQESVDYLNGLDRTIGYLDVIHDYHSEKREVRRHQGEDFPFSFGDYIVKILLGSIDAWFDALDERKVSTDWIKTYTRKMRSHR